MKNKRSPVKVGRRTGVSVLHGKNVRTEIDGTDNFDDYWTDPSESSSAESYASDKDEGNSSSDDTFEEKENYVQPFKTRKKSFALHKSASKSPSIVPNDNSEGLLVGSAAKYVGKHVKRFSTKNIQTSIKKRGRSAVESNSSSTANVDRVTFSRSPNFQSSPQLRSSTNASFGSSPTNASKEPSSSEQSILNNVEEDYVGVQSSPHKKTFDQSTNTSLNKSRKSVSKWLSPRRMLNFDETGRKEAGVQSSLQENTFFEESMNNSLDNSGKNISKQHLSRKKLTFDETIVKEAGAQSLLQEKTFFDKSMNTSLNRSQKKLLKWQSPRKQLFLNETIGKEAGAQSLLQEKTFFDKSMNTSLNSSRKKAPNLQSTLNKTESKEAGVQSSFQEKTFFDKSINTTLNNSKENVSKWQSPRWKSSTFIRDQNVREELGGTFSINKSNNTSRLQTHSENESEDEPNNTFRKNSPLHVSQLHTSMVVENAADESQHTRKKESSSKKTSDKLGNASGINKSISASELQTSMEVENAVDLSLRTRNKSSSRKISDSVSDKTVEDEQDNAIMGNRSIVTSRLQASMEIEKAADESQHTRNKSRSRKVSGSVLDKTVQDRSHKSSRVNKSISTSRLQDSMEIENAADLSLRTRNKSSSRKISDSVSDKTVVDEQDNTIMGNRSIGNSRLQAIMEIENAADESQHTRNKLRSRKVSGSVLDKTVQDRSHKSSRVNKSISTSRLQDSMEIENAADLSLHTRNKSSSRKISDSVSGKTVEDEPDNTIMGDRSISTARLQTSTEIENAADESQHTRKKKSSSKKNVSHRSVSDQTVEDNPLYTSKVNGSINASQLQTDMEVSDVHNYKKNKMISRKSGRFVSNKPGRMNESNNILCQQSDGESENGDESCHSRQGKSNSRKMSSSVLDDTTPNKYNSEARKKQRKAQPIQNAESEELALDSHSLRAKDKDDSREKLLPAVSRTANSSCEEVSDEENIQEVGTQKVVRRSKRKVVPPLARWRMERRRFRFANGEMVEIGIDPGTEDHLIKEKALKSFKKASKTKTKRKKVDHSPETTVCSANDSTKPLVLVDSVNGELKEIHLHSRFKKQDWTTPMSQSSSKSEYRICHSLWSENVSFGFVEIAVGCTKGEQYSPDSYLHFVVLQGPVVFHFQGNAYKLQKNDSITVPIETPYSIVNRGKNEALLHFCSTAYPLF